MAAIPAAKAAVVTTTITGTLTSGIDNVGVFGDPKTDLTGQAFTLTFNFDDTQGKQVTLPCGASTCGSGFQATTVNGTTAVIRIGGNGYAFGVSASGPKVNTYRSIVLPSYPTSVSDIQYEVQDPNAAGLSTFDNLELDIEPALNTVLTDDPNWEDSLFDSALGSSKKAYFVINQSEGGAQAAIGIMNPTSILITGLKPVLQFIPVTPCRIADTRNPPGAFGGPALQTQSNREFDIPQSACSIPSTAQAYSLNVTVAPGGPLGYLTLWPTGQAQPTVSTLNSDGRVKANAAIVGAGANGGVNLSVSDPTHVILDINGYFVAAGTPSALAFYPVTPCRVADTRNADGPLGGPALIGGQSRNFQVPSSHCGIPTDAQAFSMNVTAVPHGPLDYLTMWPSGQPEPLVSTLNATTGAVTANAAIVPAGANGNISLFPYKTTDVVLDINGYFAAPSATGLALYPTTPCRVLDTRALAAAFAGTLAVSVESSPCAPPAEAQAYVTNATVLPGSELSFLTLYPAGESVPLASTLNASDGAVTSNMAIVPTLNGSIDAFANSLTNLIVDLSGYFAPSAFVTLPSVR